MLVRKLQNRIGSSTAKADYDDVLSFSYYVYELCKACTEEPAAAVEPSWLREALIKAGGGMSRGDQATFVITFEAEDDTASTEKLVANCLVLSDRRVSDLHLRTVNFPLQDYRPDVHRSLPSFEEATLRLRDGARMQSTFRAAKQIFAEYNKWDDYGIILPFKDVDMKLNERWIELNGTSMPWCGAMRPVPERFVVPQCVRAWEGEVLAYTFTVRNRDSGTVRDVTFEQEAVANLGGLGLIRLANVSENERAVAKRKWKDCEGVRQCCIRRVSRNRSFRTETSCRSCGNSDAAEKGPVTSIRSWRHASASAKTWTGSTERKTPGPVQKRTNLHRGLALGSTHLAAGGHPCDQEALSYIPSSAGEERRRRAEPEIFDGVPKGGRRDQQQGQQGVGHSVQSGSGLVISDISIGGSKRRICCVYCILRAHVTAASGPFLRVSLQMFLMTHSRIAPSGQAASSSWEIRS
ncbi:hypothetical protein LTR78_010378 [Recurvomyces mirabilis]|uniref:Uncharacterized protein n=1 Tax=Recurvomyces mirabilis TaxID=574656 RepID=A0AAE0TLV7_9PEZI|nr:hypothetical protein LTR78_010378 [Recurvomyces mirabilis]KAK5150112.1 hypothetical protein LTS14_010375 [Recurvomyces mirabilis]